MATMEVTPKIADLEALILLSVQHGDFSVIEELYQFYSPHAFRLACKMLQDSEAAEDMVQEAFLRLWKNPTRYDPQRGHFAPWLFRVVHNLCIDQLRHLYQIGQYRPLLAITGIGKEEVFANIADDKIDIEEEVELKMEGARIDLALSQIPATQRRLIELAFFNGLTHTEIAQASGLPLGTVKTRIRQGLIKLKDLMDSSRRETAIIQEV